MIYLKLLAGVSIKDDVDAQMAIELSANGIYALSVNWNNGFGGNVVATTAMLTVAPLNLDTMTLAHGSPATPYDGTATALTALRPGGTGGLVMPVTASGTEVQMVSDGLDFGGGKRISLTGLSPVASGGAILILEFTPDNTTGAVVPLDFGGQLSIRRNSTNLQYGYNFGTAVNINSGTAAIGARVLLAIELDRDAGTLRHWSGGQIVTVTEINAATFAPASLGLGGAMDGRVHKWAVVTRAAGAAWPITLERLLAEFGAGGGAAGPFDRVRVIPALIQSGGRPVSGGQTEMIGPVSAQGIFPQGLRGVDGQAALPFGTGEIELNTAVPASDFGNAGIWLGGRSSVIYAAQYAWLRKELAAGRAGSAAVIGDNGFGGLYVETYDLAAPENYGRNQRYWLREISRLAAVQGWPVECDNFIHFIGTSGKDQTYAEWRGLAEPVWNWHRAECQALFGTTPTPLVVQTGGDVNTVGDLYQVTQAQLDMAISYGGIIATPQRIYQISDNNIHPATMTRALIGETVEWAREHGAGWGMMPTVTKSGSTVTVAISMLPGETLVDDTDYFDGFGGAVTCQNYGFEAEGGISAAVLNSAAGTVTLTLINPSAAWLRFAMQTQDVSGFVQGAGLNFSAHRSTLFGSTTRASAMYPSQLLRRAPVSFSGLFSGDTFGFGY